MEATVELSVSSTRDLLPREITDVLDLRFSGTITELPRAIVRCCIAAVSVLINVFRPVLCCLLTLGAGHAFSSPVAGLTSDTTVSPRRRFAAAATTGGLLLFTLAATLPVLELLLEPMQLDGCVLDPCALLLDADGSSVRAIGKRSFPLVFRLALWLLLLLPIFNHSSAKLAVTTVSDCFIGTADRDFMPRGTARGRTACVSIFRGMGLEETALVVVGEDSSQEDVSEVLDACVSSNTSRQRDLAWVRSKQPRMGS